MLRGEKDFRKDHEFKGDAIRRLREKYDQNKAIVIDDSDAVLEYLGKEGEIEVIDAKKVIKERRKNMNTL